MKQLKEWTVHQLQAALMRDLGQCQTDLERIMVRSIGGKELRLKAEAWAQVRQLTPGEVAIAQQYGYRAG